MADDIEGFYSVAYTGTVGSGMLLLIFKGSEIIGADIAGATYDGEYAIDGDGNITCNVTMKIPPNTPLVTGQPRMDTEYKVAFSISLPNEFVAPKMIGLDLPIGPVNAFFRKLREC